MTLQIMSPKNPKWNVFCTLLDDELTNGVCAGGWSDERHGRSRRILSTMGLSADDINETIKFFDAHGGGCDCEVLFNVDPD